MSRLSSRLLPRSRAAVARSISPLSAPAFLFCAMLLGALPALTARAEPTDRIVVMPARDLTGDTEATARLVSRLSTLTGTPMTLTGSTRTGALTLSLPAVVESSTLIGLLREDRAVLWADVPARTAALQKARAKAAESGAMGQKLMVRMRDGSPSDADVLAARMARQLGVGVTLERRVGAVWIVRLDAPQSQAALIDLAALLQSDPLVQYADPVLRRYTQAATPNDPYYSRQWYLTDGSSGINVAGAWAVQTQASPVTVAVIDTGILPHPDLQGKVLPGYDFISDPERARDGDGRDADPRDEGDWLNAGDCRGRSSRNSSWHGTFVAGLIAATSNNGIGIAGVDGNARIVPVRALGQCGGSDEDVFEAMLWAAGVQIDGVPPNANPAKVINLSLGGYGACAQAIQEAVNDAMAHGAIVVAAAGNETDDVSAFAPANCSGVITVGAHNRQGERTFYTNFGRRIDISAPAGDGGSSDSSISLSNDGTTTPGAAAYKDAIGTSFSAPLVAGTVSMMMARNPTLTPGRIVSILQATSRSFGTSSACRLGNFCGAGMLDSGVALASTTPASQMAPQGTVAVVEFYNPTLDHYFVTATPGEIAALDASGAWQRTGYVFFAYADPASAPAGAQPVCRFYADAAQLIDSHFFTADAAQCQFITQRYAGVWTLESAAAFYVEVPDASGACREGTLPVYRFFNGRRDANQRFTIDLSVTRGMVNKAWVVDGAGRSGAAFCSPI